MLRIQPWNFGQCMSLMQISASCTTAFFGMGYEVQQHAEDPDSGTEPASHVCLTPGQGRLNVHQPLDPACCMDGTLLRAQPLLPAMVSASCCERDVPCLPVQGHKRVPKSLYISHTKVFELHAPTLRWLSRKPSSDRGTSPANTRERACHTRIVTS